MNNNKNTHTHVHTYFRAPTPAHQSFWAVYQPILFHVCSQSAKWPLLSPAADWAPAKVSLPSARRVPTHTGTVALPPSPNLWFDPPLNESVHVTLLKHNCPPLAPESSYQQLSWFQLHCCVSPTKPFNLAHYSPGRVMPYSYTTNSL